MQPPQNFAPFINGSYGASVLFLIGISWLTLARYRRAAKQLQAAETNAAIDARP